MNDPAEALEPAMMMHRVLDGIAGEIIAKVCDIAILIDAEGVIRSLTVNPDNMDLGFLDHWVNRKIDEFLTVESRTKLALRLRDLAKPGSTALRKIELNHIDNTAWEFPIRYSMHDTGFPGEILLVGHDLRPVAQMQQELVTAQLAVEQDYETYREVEARYRLLLETVQEPVAIVDCTTGRIAEINAAAARLLGSDAETLAGSQFAQAFEGQKRTDFCEILREAGSAKNSKRVQVESRRDGKLISIYPRTFRASSGVLALCRMRSAGEEVSEFETLGRRLTSLFFNAPDAFVFTDLNGVIVDVNEAFLVMTSASHQSEIQGRSLADFLARGSVDLKVMTDNALRVGRMRNYGTKAIGVLGSQFSVDISVTSLRDGREPGFGFVLRDMTPQDSNTETVGISGPALQSVVKLVGSAPLRELVSATTEVIEKMCIEAAVDLTNNNRVAAAEMLGLSRQSLYVKLRKYELLSQGPEED
ncbi:transcriptional regulator PpsR [Tropicimonas sp. IMCC34043]|uniref:transcriptional regulator PpsR n=1 Tax=Tropicimonas sp. IMCC34043 TaxID=2248760 RepID=UPI0013001878|nr:transcriptional regulator PpsR [Tropicimonas sp. IMCC34043]